MNPTRGEGTRTRFDELHAEAAEALAYSANTLRAIRDRYRKAYLEDMANLQGLRDELESLESSAPVDPWQPTDDERSNGAADPATRELTMAAMAAEAGAADHLLRTVRRDVQALSGDLGRNQAELSRIELAVRNLESCWLFLERGDASLVSDQTLPTLPSEMQMRIIEAQEGERARLAQEIHDGPAQALSNAVFQVEYIERVMDADQRLARTELRFLRELLRRELGDVRNIISQLRPPVLVELGLNGSIVDAADTMSALAGIRILTELEAPVNRLGEAEQTVVLRIVQEALQNVRKHGAATSVVVGTRMIEEEWVLEVRDDGRGFDVGAVAARGRRNFGLQFMRERAELIGARLEVRSRPGAGTIVRLGIPMTRKES